MKFFQYNIFAKSLSSNSIPWVMTISSEWKYQIENITKISYDQWLTNIFTKEYLQHFHKNFASGNKGLMRNLWSQKIVDPSDIPRELTGLSFFSENCVKYEIDECEYHATTLPGLLTKSIPMIAEDLYQHIMDLEVYFNWENRGPRIYQTIANADPDIISLCEYDIHDEIAAYRNSSTRETFSSAMMSSGYSGFLLKSPDTRSVSGLGIFWKTDEFELLQNDNNSYFSKIDTVNIDTDINGTLSNLDLHEHWHKLSFDSAGSGGAGTATSSYQELHAKDRRHAGFLRLKHKASQKHVLVVCTHLMTTSRDSAVTNEYPGEVRLEEMETIGSKIRSYLDNSSVNNTEAPIDAIIYGGDFNIDIRDLQRFNQGLPSILDPNKEVRRFQTGLYQQQQQHIEDEGINNSDVYLQYHHDPRWVMEEAYKSIHLWGTVDGRIGENHYCTSYNRERCEWIDMVWYTSHSLQVTNLSSMATPSTPIPNETQGSDHLPLCVEFEWKNS